MKPHVLNRVYFFNIDPQIKKEKERIEKEQKDKDKGPVRDSVKVKDKADGTADGKAESEMSGDQKAKLQNITIEIERLNALIDQIQNGDGKDNQKAAKIKKIRREIERLKEEAEQLLED